MTAPDSMRSHLEVLEDLGELARIDRRVDWDLEMGAITRRCYETGAPAPLFNHVVDSEFRAVGAPHGASREPGRRLVRIATALGLSADATAREIVDRIVAARGAPGIAPVVRRDAAPCQEVVLHGDDVDLGRLPLPMLHAGDGGRYLNTLGMIVCRTPDGRWTSWSVARIMYLGPRRGVGTVVPFQHVGRVHSQWREAGHDMPFALVFGAAPVSLYAAGMPLPEDLDEVEWVGGFRGRPVDLVPCRSVDLEVPVEAEIVLEGHVSIRELGLEGPMGEYAGYVHPHYSVPQPVYEIETMTHRRDAIFPFACAGEPPEENHTIWGVGNAAEATHLLRTTGLPIATAWSPFEASNGWLVVTVADGWDDGEPDTEQLCRRIGDVVWGAKVGAPVKRIVVLEDDVDPSDIAEVVWAIDGRHQDGPAGTVSYPGKLGWPMTPYVHPDQADFPYGWTSTAAVWNCLPPSNVVRPPRTRFDSNYPATVRDRVLAHWDTDGLGDPRDARAARALTDRVVRPAR